MISIPTGVRVWLATGHTDMRKGFAGLALVVQETLKHDPHGGHLFVFREWWCRTCEVIPTFGSVLIFRILRLEIGQCLDLR